MNTNINPVDDPSLYVEKMPERLLFYVSLIMALQLLRYESQKHQNQNGLLNSFEFGL